MPKTNRFFLNKNTVQDLSDCELTQTEKYLEPIKSFSRTTYKSIYVIDYKEKGFEYVSDNPLFLCGYSAEEVKKMGYEFYFKQVVPNDLELLFKINELGLDFYENVPTKERKNYTISYDFHLKNQEGKTFLVNKKLTPIFLTEEGKIWKALCIISLSSEKSSGNIKIHKSGSDIIFEYNLKRESWEQKERKLLTEREKEILYFSIKGYTVNEIAKTTYVSPDTIKFHRKKIFEKLNVVNISEAIFCAANNKLL